MKAIPSIVQPYLGALATERLLKKQNETSERRYSNISLRSWHMTSLFRLLGGRVSCFGKEGVELTQREPGELMDWLTVGEQISKKIGRPSFGELIGSV